MVNFPGRNGRRRRVLNEEFLSASCSHTALRVTTKEDAAHVVPRYSEAAGVENHPQITDFVPRRWRSLALLIVVAMANTAGLALLHYFANPIGAALAMADASALDLAAPGSIAAWTTSVVLLLTSGVCMLVYSIRRHRIDDYRGRYRVWLAAAGASLLLSANCVIGFHEILADGLSYLTGWSALRAGAVWWLTCGGLPLMWIIVRTLLDVKECRLATALLLVAGCSYAAGAAAFLGLVPTSDLHIQSMTTGTALLGGHWMVFAAVISYARFVVLDAQGLIVNRPRISGHRKTRTTSSSEGRPQQETTSSSPASGGHSRPRLHDLQPANGSPSTSQWVDGSRPVRDHYDDDDGDDDSTSIDRKLSKSDRKRLRKLKAQNRAA